VFLIAELVACLLQDTTAEMLFLTSGDWTDDDSIPVVPECRFSVAAGGGFLVITNVPGTHLVVRFETSDALVTLLQTCIPMAAGICFLVTVTVLATLLDLCWRTSEASIPEVEPCFPVVALAGGCFLVTATVLR